MDIWSNPDISPDLIYIFFDKFAVNDKVSGMVFTRHDTAVYIIIQKDVNDLRRFQLTGEVETKYVLKSCLGLVQYSKDYAVNKSISNILKQDNCAFLLALQKQILYEYDSWDGWDVSVYMLIAAKLRFLKHYFCIAKSHDLRFPLVESKLEQVLETESQRRRKEHSAKVIQRAWFKVWLNPYHPMGEKRMHLMISELEASG